MSQLKVLSPFGPKIARLKFPQLLIKKINLEVDRITKQKKLIKKYDYSKNLVGQVKQEIQLPSIFIQKNIYKHISSSVKEYVKASTGKLTKKIKIINFLTNFYIPTGITYYSQIFDFQLFTQRVDRA